MTRVVPFTPVLALDSGAFLAASGANVTDDPQNSAQPSGLELMAEFIAVSKGLRQWSRSRVERTPRMTLARAGLLVGLFKHGSPVGMAEFGLANDLSKRSMTVIVDGLEKEGLVNRMPHPSDRRITLLELTPEGRELVSAELIPAHAEAAAVLDELPVEDRQEFLRILLRVSDLLEEREVRVSLPYLDGKSAIS